jgi:hypothetical protein
MAVAAKVAILDELGALQVEMLSTTERNLRAEAIRNRIFAPYLQQQQESLERQTDRQQKETLRCREAAETESRRTKRKAVLIELGVAKGLRLAKEHGLTGRAVAVVEWEVRSRLDILLVGDETESQVEETIEASIEPPILEWAARLEQRKQAKEAQMLDECLALGLLLAHAAWPWMKGSAVHTASATGPSTDSQNAKSDERSDVSSLPPPRPRREEPPSPTTRPPQTSASDEGDSFIKRRKHTATG